MLLVCLPEVLQALEAVALAGIRYVGIVQAASLGLQAEHLQHHTPQHMNGTTGTLAPAQQWAMSTKR